MLSGTTKEERKRAHRIFQCVAVSSRPLCVAELADVLTFDFDAETSNISNFDSSRRPLDPKEAILSIYSSLITIIDVEEKK